MPQPLCISDYIISVGYAQTFAEYEQSYGVRNFKVLNKLLSLRIYSPSISPSLYRWKDSEKLVPRVSIVTFSWPSQWFATYIKKIEKVDFVDDKLLCGKKYVDFGALQKIFQKTFAFKKTLRHFGDLTAMELK